MAFSDEQVMLTLAALTYRGFQDALAGPLHDEIVREALIDGLTRFEPVKDQWELVWGPATTRQVPLKSFKALSVFDWTAMYVVRHRTVRNKYVVAIRGTNPVASQDWLFGDLWVGTQVAWPYGSGKEVISTSTALGLASLQGLRSGHAGTLSDFTHFLAKETRDVLHVLFRKGESAFKGLTGETTEHKQTHIEQQLTRLFQHWMDSSASAKAIKAQLQKLTAGALVDPQQLRPKLMPESNRSDKLDILTFLRTQSEKSPDPLEVSVTGHSKGGALSPAVALWLREALQSDETERWDAQQRATVRCFAFAGPTPGNAAFASRLDELLGDQAHYCVNSNDMVPHAFQVDRIQQIPSLYGSRTAALEPLVKSLVADVEPLGYRHSSRGIKQFFGKLDDGRPFPAELVHQHLDAYLIELGLFSPELNAFTCFV